MRAKALSVYSLLEQSIAALFNSLRGSDSRESYVAFNDLRHYEERRKRLAKLLKQKYDDKYTTFTNSMIERWSEIDKTRNKVVHWIPKTTWIFGQPVRTALHEHPNIFGTARMTQTELEEFTNKAEFIGMLVFHFDRFLHLGDQQLAGAGKTRWSDIFQREVLYPPPDDHPRYRPPSNQALRFE